MAGAPNVRLRLSNRAENVLLVRQALSGLAETIGLDSVELNDISTAVTEACNNVVLHAYGGGEGPMQIDLSIVAEGLDVTVCDRGIGILPGVEAVEDVAAGIGLPVIRALSNSVEFNDLDGEGTGVAMHFAINHAHPLQQQLGTSVSEMTELSAIESSAPMDTTVMTVAPTSVARTVIPRVLSTLAARAYFTTDRISDTQLVADALVAHTDGAINASHLSVGVSVAPRNLKLRIGPLLSGHAGALLKDSAVDGLGPVLERLTNGHEISSAEAGEILDLRLAQGD